AARGDAGDRVLAGTPAEQDDDAGPGPGPGRGEVGHGDRTLPAYPGAMAAPEHPDATPHPDDAAPRAHLRPATLAVTTGRPPHEPDQPLNTPVTLASTYVATGDVEYGRYGNPTWT